MFITSYVAQQSCGPVERIKTKAWRIEKRSLEGPKSKSGGSKIEVWRVQNRCLEGSSAPFGAVGRSLDHPEGTGVQLGGILEASWGRLGCVLEGLEAVFGASWGRLGGT